MLGNPVKSDALDAKVPLQIKQISPTLNKCWAICWENNGTCMCLSNHSKQIITSLTPISCTGLDRVSVKWTQSVADIAWLPLIQKEDFFRSTELVLFQGYNSIMEYGSREWLHVKAEVLAENAIDLRELVSELPAY